MAYSMENDLVMLLVIALGTKTAEGFGYVCLLIPGSLEQK